MAHHIDLCQYTWRHHLLYVFYRYVAGSALIQLGFQSDKHEN